MVRSSHGGRTANVGQRELQFPASFGSTAEPARPFRHSPTSRKDLEDGMKKYLFAAAIVTAVAAPAFADDVGVHVGPVGAGVTTGETHDRTIVKEREPRDRTTVIKKKDEMGNRSKTVIHHDD
jgi:hypothetical protein